LESTSHPVSYGLSSMLFASPRVRARREILTFPVESSREFSSQWTF
jgi:hypothetical protein